MSEMQYSQEGYDSMIGIVLKTLRDIEQMVKESPQALEIVDSHGMKVCRESLFQFISWREYLSEAPKALYSNDNLQRRQKFTLKWLDSIIDRFSGVLTEGIIKHPELGDFFGGLPLEVIVAAADRGWEDFPTEMLKGSCAALEDVFSKRTLTEREMKVYQLLTIEIDKRESTNRE